MRIGPALLLASALTLGACASSSDVRSTASSSRNSNDQLPPVDGPDPARTTSTTTSPASTASPATAPTTSGPSTTTPGTRPVEPDSLILLASDLSGWDVVRPMPVPGEPTWETFDCPEMDLAWAATGRAGTRSRGSNGEAAFRNTAVEFETTEEASDVLDAVGRIWSHCPPFEDTTGSLFWSEPIEMPPSAHRTSGIVIGSESISSWALLYWQIDTTVVILEVEGDEMWTHLDPLMTTLSARLDGKQNLHDTSSGTTETTTGTTMPHDEEPKNDLPVLVPATMAPIVPATPVTSTITPTTAPSTTINTDSGVFPPVGEDWADHPLAHLAPAPAVFGPGWTYDEGSRRQAAPADPDDMIEDCETPLPPTLEGYEVQYEDPEYLSFTSILVGEGTAAESQIWLDAFRALVACELDPTSSSGSLELVDWTIEGADDALLLAGSGGLGDSSDYTQVIGVARVDGILMMAVAIALDPQAPGAPASTVVQDALASMLAAL